MMYSVVRLVLALIVASESLAKTYFKEDIVAKLDDDYDLVSEKKNVDGFEYTLHNLSFLVQDERGGNHERVKRLPGAFAGNFAPLCIATFSIQAYRAPLPGLVQPKDDVIVRILNDADLIATQEIRNIPSIMYLLSRLNAIAGAGAFSVVHSNALPGAYAPSGYVFAYDGSVPRSEHYAMFYRVAKITHLQNQQFPPFLLPNGLHQQRPPFAAEFRYTPPPGFLGANSFEFTVMTIHTSPFAGLAKVNTEAEIDNLHDSLQTLINVPYCFSQTAVILGDFNQGTHFIPAGYMSTLDWLFRYTELLYQGGSTSAVTTPQNHDRLYVHGDFGLPGAVPNLAVGNPNRAEVQRFYLNAAGVLGPLAAGVGTSSFSDHYPVRFQVDHAVVPGGTQLTPGCVAIIAAADFGGGFRKRRSTDQNTCEECLAMMLTNGVFPPGAVSSSDALNVIPAHFERTDERFLNLISLQGAAFIFANEERTAAWCGRNGRSCRDCRGVSSERSIVNQCSDRIMCPNLAVGLVVLLRKLQNCTADDRTLIVHEAWDERDSAHPRGFSPNNTLHGRGLEAKISVSKALPSLLHIERRDYASDNSLLSTLASLAICVGFHYVKMNADNTISVAVRDCSTDETRVPMCTKPTLANGKYKVPHKGSKYQMGEVISAVCDPGYRLQGTINRICVGENGMDDWTGEEPTCVAVCDPFMAPNDPCVSVFIDPINDLVEFRCQDNCNPACQRTWMKCDYNETRQFVTVNSPYCTVDPAISTNCSAPPRPFKSDSQIIRGTVGEVCSVVQFSCLSGFTLVGFPKLTCQSNGLYDHPVPFCSGQYLLSDFTVAGFEYFRANATIDIRDPSSLAAATYEGKLRGPYPSFPSGGVYDAEKDRVVFVEGITLPFLGLSLSFTTEVKLDILQYVTDMRFHGHLENPLYLDVTGVLDGGTCGISINGEAALPSRGVSVQADVVLNTCNCTTICRAEAVSVTVNLFQPWNITLFGSYRLGNENVTEVSAAAQVELATLNFNVSVTMQSDAGQLSLQDIALGTRLKSPFGLDLYGSYSRSTGLAQLSGALDVSIVTLTLRLTVDVESETLSYLEFSGSVSSPFMMSIFGSYSLIDTNSSQITVGGSLDIPGIVNFRGTIDIDLFTRTITSFTFEGMLAQPLAVMVMGSYNIQTRDELVLAGNVALLGSDSLVNFYVSLNTSGAVSIREIGLSGRFPPPLDFITYSGVYRQDCSCATLMGSVVQTFITVEVSTDLIFAARTRPTITELQVNVSFHRPLNLVLAGVYRYYSTNTSILNLFGEFNIPQVMLTTELELLLQGMQPPFTWSVVRFRGSFPPPLSLDIQGEYSMNTSELALSGSLMYDFAQLEASAVYSFRDDVHNRSSMLSNVAFAGRLTNPFQLEITGEYVFAASHFSLQGMLSIGEYLMLSVSVALNTSTSPPSIDVISFNGTFSTPISFQGEFSGMYTAQTRSAVLMSHLDIMGALLLDATARLTLDQNNMLSFQSVLLEGSLNSPLSVRVTAEYIPSNVTKLNLMGEMSIGPVTFMVLARAELVEMMNQLVIREVTVSGMVESPFRLTLSGTYLSGESLLLSANLSFTELQLAAMATVNLMEMPRKISSFQFSGMLAAPFNAVVSGRYSNGSDLVLTGMLDLASLQFSVEVTFNTTASPVALNSVQFTVHYSPLSVTLVGTYSRPNQRLDLLGTIMLDSVDIRAMTSIDFSQQMRRLGTFTMSVTIQNPSVFLLGSYDPSNRTALLLGELRYVDLEFRASALLQLGSQRVLQRVMFGINYTIPFGSHPQFMLSGTYDAGKGWLILEGSISKNIVSVHALLIASRGTPTVRLAGLIIPRLDIAALARDYIGLDWPTETFPLNFTDLAIYYAHADLSYDSIDYLSGFHARGEIKIFVFPRFIIDASLLKNPPRFRVSFQLAEPLEWGIIAICGTSSCNTTGPSLSVEVGSGMSRFVFEGDLRLFDIHVGSVALNASRNRLSATFTLSREVLQKFVVLGSDPLSVSVFWNDEGFHTNLQIPGVMFPNFNFTNLQSRSICKKLGSYISNLAVDTPFHLDNSFIAREIDNETIWLGIVFQGYVTLSVLGQDTGVNASIAPIMIGFTYKKGQKLSWGLVLKSLEQGLLSAGEQILDDLLKDSEAVALFLAGKVGQLAIDQAAQEICKRILDESPPEESEQMTESEEKSKGGSESEPKNEGPKGEIEPEPEPKVPKPGPKPPPPDSFPPPDIHLPDFPPLPEGILGFGLGTKALLDVGGAKLLKKAGAAFLLLLGAGAAGLGICLILRIFGGCGAPHDRDEHNIDKLKKKLQQRCDSGYCDGMCEVNGDSIVCSCYQGSYLDIDGHSCIRYDRCRTGNNHCNSNDDCMDSSDTDEVTCECRMGYTGDGMNCDDIDECSMGSPCPSNSECRNTGGSFECNCDDGYKKDHDECKDIDECSKKTDRCPTNSTCTNTEGSYDCDCNKGFEMSGQDCSDINECKSDDVMCGPHSVCRNTIGSFLCPCHSGYSRQNGSGCIDIDECYEGIATCSANNSHCTNTEGSYQCDCNIGFMSMGEECVDINECESGDACGPHSICMNSIGSFFCSCLSGYSMQNGSECMDIDECYEGIAMCPANTSHCTNTEGSYQCDCNIGFIRMGEECSDIDECESGGACGPHAVCMNSIGSFSCPCQSGYSRLNESECMDIDECTEGIAMCPANSSCTNTEGSYQCDCDTGFMIQGTECFDIDECESDHACGPNSICMNSIGSFSCSCESGYSRQNGSECMDIDECAESTPCDMNAWCLNLPGSYNCTCMAGYEGDGETCTDENECLQEGICMEHSTCVNSISSFSCLCDEGFFLSDDGQFCNDTNECDTNMFYCIPEAMCVNTVGSYVCECRPGYAGNGTACEDIDECNTTMFSCIPEAMCVNTVGSYTCECLPGYAGNGTVCEDIDECDTSMFSCIPEAVCVNTVGSYECECIPGYEGNGTLCEDIDECNSTMSVCDEHATCTNLPGNYSCECISGFSANGTSCVDIDECLSPDLNMCDQFATCENTLGSYNCTCLPDFTGNGVVCTLISCPPLTPNPHTEFVSNEGNMIHQMVVFQCTAGFIPIGPPEVFNLTCLSTGEWSSRLPECTPDIVCRQLPSPPNGRARYEDITRHPGGVVNFTCNTGYTLEGESRIVCQPDGEWSAPEPNCTIGLSIDFLFPYGSSVGDSIMQDNDDGAAEVQLTAFFPYFDRAERNLFIANNGILSFREAFPIFSPEPFPNGVIMIAPFWADVDTRHSQEDPPEGVAREDIGKVYYREEFDSDLLEKAGQEIREAFIGLSTFTPTSLFIATWRHVGYYSTHVDKLNTFQCVLVTDGILSFVIYLYPQDGIQWTTGDASKGLHGFGGTPAQVGFNAGDGVRFSILRGSRTPEVVNVDEKSNVRKPGVYIYQVDGTAVPGGCADDADSVNVFPVAGSALGGSLLSLSGPCFDEYSFLECTFEYGVTSRAVFASSLRAYCPIPMLSEFGILQLTISGRTRSGEDNVFPVHSYTATSLDFHSDVEFEMPGGLLYSDGDSVTLTWTPTAVLPTEIAAQYDYQVTIEVHAYTSGAWSLFQEVATMMNNGTATVHTLQQGPGGSDPLVPIAFRIRAADSVNLESYIRPPVQAGLIGIWSPVAYKISSGTYPAGDLCSEFVQSQAGENVLENTIPCPCRANQARIGNSMFVEQRSSTAAQMRRFFYSSAKSCFLSTTIGPNGEGTECCYDSSGLLLTGPTGGGTVDRFASRLVTNPWDHRVNDLIPQIHCCKAPTASDSTCKMYYNVRPSDGCSHFNPALPALLFGDPHMITLDGLQYTYNGAGEYVILDALNGEFILQARTEPVERSDGGTPVGTAFTAFAVKMRDSDIIEIQRSTFRGLTMFVNRARVTLQDQEDISLYNVTLSSLGNSTVAILFEGGLTIEARNRNNFLLIQLASLPTTYQNNTRGLLGVWNGDPDDDLQRPDGTVVSPNSTLTEIHEQFGELWQITAEESLFTYIPGQSTATFDNPSFTPVFDVADLPFANMPGVAELCGDSVECLFDVGATGDLDAGRTAVEVQITYNETVEVSQPTTCEPECQNGAACVSTDVCNCPTTYTGSRCEIDVDECTLEIDNCEQNCTNTEGGFNCSCLLKGFVLHMNEASCTDINECSDHNGGCRCDKGFGDGHSCVADCANMPGSFQCACNEGHFLAVDGFTCVDVDECALNNGDCSCQVGLDECFVSCRNLNGSHICECSEGYALQTDQRTCIDINECDASNGGCLCDPVLENSSCMALCINSDGSHSCDCNTGYQLTGSICIDIDECTSINSACGCDTELDGSNCMAECRNTFGSFVCMCPEGYYLDSDTLTCLDINECSANDGGCRCDEGFADGHSCVANCVNMPGSFQCACNEGHFLAVDGFTCIDVDECTLNNGDCSCQVGLDGCSVSCRNLNGSHICECSEGYAPQADQRLCIDIDECSIDAGGCQCHSDLGDSSCSSTCENTIGSFQCSCNDGYQLDDTDLNCIDINECNASNGGCVCDPVLENSSCMALCINSDGSHSCECNTGYQVTGSSSNICIDIDECASNNGGCGCGTELDGSNCTAECRNTFGSFLCQCSEGYYLDSNTLACLDIDECAVKNGGCQCDPTIEDEGECTATCTNFLGQHQCSCSEGYFLDADNFTCKDINECFVVENGGCECEPELEGCTALCNNQQGSYICSCSQGFQVDLVNNICKDVNECSEENGGCVCASELNCTATCTNTIGSSECYCNDGHYLDSDGKICLPVSDPQTRRLSPSASVAIVILIIAFIFVLITVLIFIRQRRSKKTGKIVMSWEEENSLTEEVLEATK